MAERVILHVGAMKSGTSYLQALLFAQQARLAERGVLLPGATWAEQVRAVRQAVGGAGRPAWQAMANDVAGHPGAAVISMEYLAACGPRQAQRICRSLGGDVEVVVTARDLNRTLVSMWQETVQNGRTWTWEQYLQECRETAPGDTRGVADRTTAGGTFWRQQHLLRIVRDWGSAVGPERVVVVVVPPPGAGRTVLAERFAEATGLDLDVSLPVTTANQSLGLASVLVLRRLNELLDAQGLRFPAGSAVRKGTLAKQVLAVRRSLEPALGLAVDDWVVAQTDATVRALSAEAVSLVGDPVDLTPVAVPGVGPGDVEESEVTEAALAALAFLVTRQTRRSSRAGGPPARAESTDAPTSD